MARRRGRIGLRGRIAWGVFAAVLVSSTAASAVAYAHLSHSATEQFRDQARRQAESDVYGAAVSAQLFGNDGTFSTTDPSLENVFTATFQNLFLPDKKYAVVALKPGPNNTYSFISTGPGDDNGDTNTLHRTVSPALLAATPFTDYVKEGMALTTHELDVDGHWLAIGGVTGRGTAPGYYRAPVVAVDYIDMSPLRTQIADYRVSFVVITAAAALIAAVFGWLLAGLIQRPVRYAAAAARRFGTGDRSVRLPVQGRDAVADLAHSFNGMADELTSTVTTLEGSEARQRQFVADVSHELRTPMTTLVAAAAALDDPATRDRAAALVAPQLRRLARLTEDLVETSLLDNGPVRVDRDTVDLLALCRDAAEHSAAPDQVTVTGSGDAFAAVDARRVHTVLRNLISNALRHGDGPVEIEVSGDAETVVVTVTDHGPGLPPELGDAIFDRFVRADRSRTVRAGVGSGLGLSLARENATLHGGTLTATDRPGGGAQFALTLPRTADTPVPAASPSASAAVPSPPPGGPRRRLREWSGRALEHPARLAVAAGVAVLVVVGVVAALVVSPGRDPQGTASPPTPTSQDQQFQDLFGSGVPVAPLQVVASTAGPEGTTVDVVQGRNSDGLCTAVRVSTPSADPAPVGSCGPETDDTQPAPVGTFGGAWTWVSPTTGTSWSGWYGLGATAASVQLRVDNQPAGRAVPAGGTYVLPAVPDTRTGCRTVVGLAADGKVEQISYLSIDCDPAFRSTPPS